MIGLAKQFQTFRSVKGLGTEFLWMAMEFLPHTSTKNGEGSIGKDSLVEVDWWTLEMTFLQPFDWQKTRTPLGQEHH